VRIRRLYSHLNGQEHILVHKPRLWKEIEHVVAGVDAESCKTKESREKNKKGRMLYSPVEINRRFRVSLVRLGWHESRTDYWITADHRLIRKTMGLDPAQQKVEIERAGETPIASYNQTDFVKERLAVEVQFGKYAFVAYDLFVKHMAFFVGDKIDVGIEILPMKDLQGEMSSGVPYYERSLYDLIRQGRGVPAVPLVLVGVSA
jgi:hypothetical protein